MYSVEDLLISHGYKPPRNNAPSSSEGRRLEVAESGSTPDSHGKMDSHREDTSEYGERNWKSKESSSSEVELQGDFHTASDRSCDGKLGMTCQPKPKRDLNYWRRRGQDFSVLLNYADVRGQHGAEYRVQPQGWDEAGWPRTKVAEGQEPRRTVADRKWQSLGTEEWRPVVGLGQQLFDGESERWAREQHYTKAAESSIHSRSKGKSQSLPRELLSESLQAMPIVGSQHVDATTFLGPYGKHNKCMSSEGLLAERYRPAVHASLLPRFGRPVKPPSYDAHQQTRNSSEMLAGDHGPRCRSRDKLSGWSKTGEMRQDSLTHQPAGSGLGPPGYIPPPSYKRPLNQKRDQKNYDEVSHFRLKGDLQPGTWEALKWYSRPRGGSWTDYQGHRSAPCQKMTNPGYLDQHLGCVQYLPFNDPRLRHISGGQCGNTLTDADKIRNIHREIPNAKVLEQSSPDSAFLPNEGLIPSTDVSKISVNENDSSSGWYGGLHSGNDNPITFDQNCNEYHTEIQTAKLRQNGSADQEFSDLTTQLKNISPDAMETTKPVKRKSETIFCLVSVPVHLQSNRKNSDQNNNETLPDPAEQSAPSTESMDHLQNQSLQITSSTSLELPPPLNGVTNRISIGKSSLKESVLTKSLQPSKHIGLRYSSSWPGDQYRDQETQTSSSEAPEGSHSCLSLQAQDQGQPVSDTNVEGSLRTDYSSMYSFHAMKGQKTLQPSSNSAFSKTSTYSDWPTGSTGPMGRPTRKQKERDSLLVRNIEAVPTLCNGEEAFGQFMLKPVGRRPWDAIEELESFNKELQDQFSQEASVDKCMEDIDAACRDLLECRTISNNTGNDKMPVRKLAKESRLPAESRKKATSAFRSRTAVGDPQYREGKSAFSRPVAKAVSFSDHLQNDVLVQSEGSFTNYRTPGQMIKKTEPKWVSKLSVPMSLNKDVGFTELPSSNVQWAAKEPVHDVSASLYPPEFEDFCHSLQLTHESEAWATTVPVKSRPLDMDISQDSCKAFSSDSKQESWFSTTETEGTGKNRIPRFSGARSVNVPKSHRLRGHGGPIWIVSNRLTEEMNSEGVSVTTSDWRSQLSLSEEHLESLHIKAKTNSMPEDLSTLYEVKCAEGIPENESIEQRAARILGIEVPAESLFVVDQKGEREVIESSGKGVAFPSQDVPETSGNENQNLITQSKEVILVNEGELDVELTVPTGEDGLVTLTDGDSSENRLDLDPGLPDELLGDEIKMCVAISDDNESQRDGDIQQNHSGLSMTPETLQDLNSTLSCQTDPETPERDGEPQQPQSRLIFRSSEGDVEDGTKMEEQLVSEDFSRTRRPSRGGTVAKREITLDLCYPPDSALMRDMEMPSFSDPYDPSHVERV